MTRPDLIGQVVELPEPHYLFGLGPVRLRVTRVYPGVSHHHGVAWVTVDGDELGHRDASLGSRQVLVQARVWAALPRQRMVAPARRRGGGR